MNMIQQFIDYGFHYLHRQKEMERLYNIVDIEVLFSSWKAMKYDYGITDKKIFRIIENDIEDFIFKMDFYSFFISANDIHDYLINKYHYDTKQFETKRKRQLRKIKIRIKLFDWIIKIVG